MDCSYPLFPAPRTSTQQQPQQQHQQQQQAQSYIQMRQQCWLLQQPADSGYADGDDDLFSQAFKSYVPDMNMMQEWAGRVHVTPSLSDASSSASSPFEYADSLVLSTENWQPYEPNFNAGYCMDVSAYGMPDQMINTTAINTDTSCVALASQHGSQDVAPLPALQPSLMEDSFAAQESLVSRPRQREHHTAVEQRYRKNLNQQFINLRSAIPNIQTSQPQRAGQPAKPSKCEVLAGAADYIKQLEEENRRLKGISEEGSEASRKRARTML